MPCNNPCRFFWGALRPSPSGVKWTRMVRPFQARDIFKWNGHMPSVSCTKWPLVGVSPMKVKYDAKSNRPWNIIHYLPCNNPCTLLFGPLGLLFLVWSELGWSILFNQREIFKWNGHTPAVSCTKWPLLGVSPMKVNLMQNPTDHETPGGCTQC